MSRRIKRGFSWVLLISCLIISVCIGVVNGVNNVSAEPESEPKVYSDYHIKKHALYMGLRYCYGVRSRNWGSAESGAKGTINFEEINGDDAFIDSIIANEDASIFRNGGTFYTPTGFFGQEKFECFSREEDDNLMSILEDYVEEDIGSIKINDYTARTEYYSGMGYEPSSSTGSASVEKKMCYSLKYQAAPGNSSLEEGYTNKLCISLDKDNNILNVTAEGDPTIKEKPFYLNAMYGGEIATVEDKEIAFPIADQSGCSNKGALMMVGHLVVSDDVMDGNQYFHGFYSDGYTVFDKCLDREHVTVDAFKAILATIAVDANNNDSWDNDFSFKVYEDTLNEESSGDDSQGPIYNVYTFRYDRSNHEDSLRAFPEAVRYLEESPSDYAMNIRGKAIFLEPEFDATEKYYIYLSYIRKNYSPNIAYSDCYDTSEYTDSRVILPIIFKNEYDVKNVRWCPVNNASSEELMKSIKVRMDEQLKLVGSSETMEMNFEDLAKKLQELVGKEGRDIDRSKLPPYDEQTGGEEGEYADPVDTENEGQVDACYNAGVESLSWIACPFINNSAQTISAIDELTENWLMVGTNLYDSESASYIIWGTMRDIANILMAVILLVIIFSQLTGYGIDNYGVKKILPKLILMAILVNLSFYVCQIAIDLSNILGSGLNQLFRGISVRAFGVDAGSDFLYWVISMLFAAVGVTGTFAGVAIPVISLIGGGGNGIMIVVLLLLLILTALVAILIFFGMLGARMIIIMMCSAVSPIAFVLYILPNTRELFKKWWNAFKASLIIFPICGSLGGIGYLIKCMVRKSGEDVSSANFWMYLVAVVAPFLPFFVLPSLLKAALAALGKVGSALTSVGNFMRNGVNQGAQAIRNTERYKDALQAAQERARFGRARRTFDRLNARGGTLSERNQERRLRAYQALAAEDKKKNEMMNATQMSLNALKTRQGLEADQANEDNLMYNNANFVSGLQKQGDFERGQKLQNAVLYNDNNYVRGKESQNDAKRYEDYKRAVEWGTNTDMAASARKMSDANLETEKYKSTKIASNPNYTAGMVESAKVAADAEEEKYNMFATDPNYVASLRTKNAHTLDNEVEDTKLFGNADYVSALNTQLREARDRKVADTLPYNNADFVEGERRQANNQRQAKLDRNTAWGTNADIARSDAAKNKLALDNEIADTLLYNDADFVEGERRQVNNQRIAKYNRGVAWGTDSDIAAGGQRFDEVTLENEINRNTAAATNTGYIEGMRNTNQKALEHEIRTKELYRDSATDMLNSLEQQYRTQEGAAVRKMNEEKIENMVSDKAGAASGTPGTVVYELRQSLSSGGGVEAVERMSAAVGTLLGRGDADKVLEVFGTHDFNTLPNDLRDRAVKLAATSGNPLLKAWAKSSHDSLKNYVSSTEFRDYIKDQGPHVFDSADKETLEFLANNMGGSVPVELMHSITMSSANNSANDRAIRASEKMIDSYLTLHPASGRYDLGQTYKAEDLTKISLGVATKLGTDGLANAIAEINKPGNEALRARVDPKVAAALGIG